MPIDPSEYSRYYDSTEGARRRYDEIQKLKIDIAQQEASVVSMKRKLALLEESHETSFREAQVEARQIEDKLPPRQP